MGCGVKYGVLVEVHVLFNIQVEEYLDIVDKVF